MANKPSLARAGLKKIGKVKSGNKNIENFNIFDLNN